MPDRSAGDADPFSSLSQDQKRTLAYLEKTVGGVRVIDYDHPFLSEFELGPNAVLFTFDNLVAGVRADGGMLALPRLKRV